MFSMISDSPTKPDYRNSLHFLIGWNLLRIAGLLILVMNQGHCSTRSASFSPLGRHPALSQVPSTELELVFESGSQRPSNFLSWRARVIGYDRSDLVAASILGPYFDAEKNPAGLRPLYFSDGYFHNESRNRITLPADRGALYIRLFQRIRSDSWWGQEILDDEFLALHIQMKAGSNGTGKQQSCEASFWKIHNPVREIMHCYVDSPSKQKRLRIKLDSREGVPIAEFKFQSLITE